MARFAFGSNAPVLVKSSPKATSSADFSLARQL